MPEDKKSGTDGKARLREPNYFICILVCVYLLYLSYQIISDLVKKGFQDNGSYLLLAFAVIIALGGICFIFISLRAIAVKGKKEVAEYERIKAEEKLAEASAQYDDDSIKSDETEDGEAGEGASDISSESDE